MEDPSAFWAELDGLGEDAVRARLAREVFGPRRVPLVQEWLRRIESTREQNRLAEEREHRAADIQFRRRSNSAARVANIVAGTALLLAAISALFSYRVYSDAHRENVLIKTSRLMADYAATLEPGLSAGGAALPTYWEVLLVNNGQQTVSVLSLEIRLLEPGGEWMYSGLVDAVLDEQLQTTSPPWSIEQGKPLKLIARLRLQVTPTAYSELLKESPNGQLASVQHAIMQLASLGQDFFGDSLEPMRSGAKTVGFKVVSMAHQPTVAFHVSTARGTRLGSAAFWYPSPGQ
jgi:hypothetical protein